LDSGRHICLYVCISWYSEEGTRVYLLALKMEPHSTWSVFLGVLIPRRSWFIWNWTARIFTTVGCHCVTPPPPLIEVLNPLRKWFHYPIKGLIPCYDFWTGILFSLPGECFSTNPSFGPFCWIYLAVREFLISASLSVCFQLLNFLYHEIEIPKKIARPRGPLYGTPAPSRTVIRCNSVPRGNRDTRPDTPECAGLGYWRPAIFVGIGPL